MIIVADIGNTNIVLGAYKGPELLNSWRMATRINRTADETGVFICSVLEKSGYAPEDVENCIISSVVPDITYSLTHAFQKYFNIDPMVVHYKMKMDIRLGSQENPREVGADRIVNCQAAYKLYGGPIIVIDYGTATTYDVVDAEGNFLTGITAPGIKICAEALFDRTALLNKVELAMPPSMLVENTTESIQAGIVFGRIGETEYIVARLKKELGIPNAKVAGTGGLARIISQGTDIFNVINPNLTLEGLRWLYEMNK